MNVDLKRLMQAVAENNMEAARRITKGIIEKDETNSNKGFCQRMQRRLNVIDKPKMYSLESLAEDISPYVFIESPAETFKSGRYFVTAREKILEDKITTMYHTSRKLAEMEIPYLNTVLLYGESGVGKTCFGRYLAYKLGLSFLYMNFAWTIDSLLGKTARNLTKVFNAIADQRCVLMLDEIDAIGMKRGQDSEVGEMSRIVIALMQLLDKVGNEALIIGATNRFDILDPALVRRFTIKHDVKRLPAQERYKMIVQFLNDVNIEYDEADIEQFARCEYPQSEIMNHVTMAIAAFLSHETKQFQLITKEKTCDGPSDR